MLERPHPCATRTSGWPNAMLLYASTIALSAFLLFLVQPIIAKQILPWFGDSSAVWTACMVFFQCILLAGYFYAETLIRRVSARRQTIVHTALLLLSLAVLPIVASEAFKPQADSEPVGRILLLLAVTIGLPYLMLSTTGPLVQAWYARRFEHGQVYRLYALSNVASLGEHRKFKRPLQADRPRGEPDSAA